MEPQPMPYVSSYSNAYCLKTRAQHLPIECKPSCFSEIENLWHTLQGQGMTGDQTTAVFYLLKL